MENKKQGGSVIGIMFIIFAILGIFAFIATKNDEKRTEEISKEISSLNNRYYYNQLDNGYKKYGKQVYNKLYENKESLKRGNYEILLGEIFSDELEKDYDEGEKYSITSIFAAKIAFKYENPEMFYVDFDKMGNKCIKSDKYRVILSCEEGENYYINGVSSKEDVEKMEQEIKSATSQIMDELKNLSSDYDKIKRVHDYLIETIEYTETENAHNIYGALVEKKCVCEGYALAFQYFMNELDINSMIVGGDVKYGDGTIWLLGDKHAWNYIKLDGNWYAVDTTWDDVENMEYKYFLKGQTSMDIDHTVNQTMREFLRFCFENFQYKVVEDEEFIYPMLSTTDYQK